jgi:hypothetical protein
MTTGLFFFGESEEDECGWAASGEMTVPAPKAPRFFRNFLRDMGSVFA